MFYKKCMLLKESKRFYFKFYFFSLLDLNIEKIYDFLKVGYFLVK